MIREPNAERSVATDDDSSNNADNKKINVMPNEFFENRLNITRKHFLGKLSLGLGSVALGSLLIKDLFSGGAEEMLSPVGLPHFAPKAKRIIYLFQNGAPSQLESFDYKPH
jgi:hypothetical protein